jgi:hypothetical protein
VAGRVEAVVGEEEENHGYIVQFGENFGRGLCGGAVQPGQAPL